MVPAAGLPRGLGLVDTPDHAKIADISPALDAKVVGIGTATQEDFEEMTVIQKERRTCSTVQKWEKGGHCQDRKVNKTFIDRH